jgi:hypothetical protein
MRSGECAAHTAVITHDKHANSVRMIAKILSEAQTHLTPFFILSISMKGSGYQMVKYVETGVNIELI